MDLRWTRKLAYAIGLIATDGCLSKDGRHIDFTSKDLDQIETFRKILNLKCKIEVKRNSRQDECFRVQFSNVVFYHFLQSIGLHPNKSKTIKKIMIPDNYFIDFLRGNLDGDGYSYSYWDKVYPSSFRFYIVFTSASKLYLGWIHQKLTDLFELSGSIRTSPKVSILSYAKADSIFLAKKLYYNKNVTCLKRKRFKIEHALGIIGS